MWAEYLKCLFILWWLIYKTRVASQPQNQIKARIGQNVTIPCPLDIPKLIHIGWYRCTLEDDCRNHWDKHRVAHIENKTLVYVDYPNKFQLKTNGILTIIEITPEDDYKVFICKGKEQFSGTVDNVTILKIITEAPKISYTPPEEYNVVQGMPLYLECEADGYPYPWVSWIHKQEVLLTRSKAVLLKRINTTESYHGEYTCHAENPLGNTSHTIQVHVIGTPSKDPVLDGKDWEKVGFWSLLAVLLCTCLIVSLAVVVKKCWKKGKKKGNCNLKTETNMENVGESEEDKKNNGNKFDDGYIGESTRQNIG